jgi:hypothetical protein
MRFYLDEHISGAVVTGLESRGHNVLTMQGAGRSGHEDIDQLEKIQQGRKYGRSQG